ncbi:MAG: DUF3617 domain-containing protein [Sulfuriferula sp.]
MLRTALVSCFLAACSHLSQAKPINLEPGLWATHMQMQMNGVAAPSGDRVQTRCMTAQDMEDVSQFIPQIARKGCVIQPARRSGNAWSWTLDCAQGPVKERGMGQVTYLSATHYTGILETVVDMPGGQVEQIKISYDSQRKGVCAN